MPGRSIDRRRMLCWCCAGTALGFTSVRAGAAASDAVPAAQEARHHVIFADEALRVMRVLIPPGDYTRWHTHTHDFVITVLKGSSTRSEEAGESRAVLGEMVTNTVLFAPYAQKALTHQVHNTSTWLNHQLAFEILTPGPGRYGAADRGAEPAYRMVFDNPRVRAWRLKLEPGAVAAPVVQNGPGLRVILAGERVIDTGTNGSVLETDIRAGDAAMLAPDTRSVANGGGAPLDMIEYELR